MAMNIRRLREVAGLTQAQAAKLAGIGFRHFQSIEAGACNINLRTLAALGRALHVDPVVLVTASPKKR